MKPTDLEILTLLRGEYSEADAGSLRKQVDTDEELSAHAALWSRVLEAAHERRERENAPRQRALESALREIRNLPVPRRRAFWTAERFVFHAACALAGVLLIIGVSCLWPPAGIRGDGTETQTANPSKSTQASYIAVARNDSAEAPGKLYPNLQSALSGAGKDGVILVGPQVITDPIRITSPVTLRGVKQ